MAAAVGLIFHHVVDLRNVVVHDGCRQRLRRNLAVACRVECITQCFLGRIVRIQHIVVGEAMIHSIIRLPRDLIGKLRRFLDVPGAGSAVIGEISLPARQRKRDVPLIARDNACIADSTCIRREIDVRSRTIFAAPVIDLLRRYRCMGCLVVHLEAVACDLTWNDCPVEVDLLIRDGCLGATVRRIEQLIVARVVARETDIRILELVVSGVDLLVARRIRIFRPAYVCEVDGIHRIVVIPHDRAILNGLAESHLCDRRSSL